MSEDAPPEGPEQASQSHFGELFAPAVAFVGPMIGPMLRGEISEYIVTRTLHDQFPALSVLEVQVLIELLSRYQKEGRLGPLLEQARTGD